MPSSSRCPFFLALAVHGLLTTGSACLAEDFQFEPHQAAQDHVAQLEHQLQKQLELVRKGAASKAEVDAVLADLYKARHDLAAMRGERKTMVAYDAALLKVRQRELKRLQMLKGRGHRIQLQLARAQRRVFVCRYLVADNEGRQQDREKALQQAVHWCERELEYWEEAVSEGHAARVKLSFVLNRLVCGQNLMAKESGHRDDVAQQLKQTMSLLQGDLEMVKKLRQQGAATVFDELYSHANLLNAQVRLAHALGKTDDVRQRVTTLLATNERLLEILLKPSSLTYLPANLKRTFRTAIAKELERDRQRLKAVSRGQGIQDDLSVATLGP